VSNDQVFAAVFFNSPDVPARAAIESKSASQACTLVPIARPKFVLAVGAEGKSDKLLALTKNVVPEE